MRVELSLPGRVAYAAYDAASALALLLCIPASPYLWWKGLAGGAGQRLGFLPTSLRELRRRPVWVHAASVGETLAAAPLVAKIREHDPATIVAVSTTTLTGQTVARRELSPEVVTLLPVDAFHIVDRVFRKVRPQCLILVETEIWPGLIRAARRVDCPVVMVSGRLSARSIRSYRWVAPLIRAALGSISCFAMQTEVDAQRIVRLGAPASRVMVTGNLKGGREASSHMGPAPIGGLAERPVLIAASTQPGEEEFVLDATRNLFETRPDLLLVLAPRRPERFAEVDEMVRRTGLRHERRSSLTGAVAPQSRILLLDTVGELARLLPCACAVFVGGSIAPLGGHNVLEPAACGKPVAFGPHIETVADVACELEAAGAAVMVRAPRDLENLWRRLLNDPEERRKMGEQARRVAELRSRAVERTWAVVKPYIDGAVVTD